MKKIIAFFLVLTIGVSLSACGQTKEEYYQTFDIEKQEPSANLDILTSGEWEYSFPGCSYTLRMYKDGSFVNFCGCGSPAGYGDLVEHFLYDDETKTIYLYDEEDICIGTGKVLEIDKERVVIEKYDEVCEYYLYEKY